MNENKHHPIADVVPVFEHEWNDYEEEEEQTDLSWLNRNNY